MPIDVEKLVETLIALPQETEWLEFKQNRFEPDEFGEYISALSNSAILAERRCAYLIFGVEDGTHAVVGSTVDIHRERIGNEPFINWIPRFLEPRVTFRIEVGHCRGQRVVVVEIDPAFQQPVRFRRTAYIRNGPHKRPLSDFPEKERELWRATDRRTIEGTAAVRNVAPAEVLGTIDADSLFALLGEPRPVTDIAVLDRIGRHQLIVSDLQGGYDITTLGILAFGRDLTALAPLSRKTLRIVRYRGIDKLETIDETTQATGYAAGFQDALRALLAAVPSREVIVSGVRRRIPVIPELALREGLANALVHQDFTVAGAGPLIEVYTDRVEFTNPGRPLVETDRLLNDPPRSRNEALASLMRRLGICEERGSGIDKIVASIEHDTLPPPLFRATDDATIITLFAERPFVRMNQEERVRACYLHACLRYASNDPMSNSSLRERLGLAEGQHPQASAVIRAAIEAERIKPLSEEQGRRNARYIPFWA